MAAPGRIVGLDVARCLALAGMVAVHVLADGDPLHDVAHGRAAALFAVLAGVAVALLTGRDRPVTGRARLGASSRLVVRAVLIAAIGLVLGELDSGLAVILTYYGLLFLLGLPFVGLGSRALFGLAAGWVVVAPVASQLIRPHLPERGYQVPSLASLDQPGLLLADLSFTGYYPVVPWLAYLLVGMAVGRLDLSRRSGLAAITAAGVGVAAVATLVSRAVADPVLAEAAAAGMYGVTPDDRWGWLLVDGPHTATPFDLAQTIGSALAVIGGCLLVVGVLRGPVLRGVAVLFGAGTMTLTLYSLHVVLRTDAAWPPDHGTTAYRWHLLVLLWIGAAFVALGWRGPLERIVTGVSRLVTGAPRTSAAARGR